VFRVILLESLLIGVESNKIMNETRKRSVVKSIVWRIICIVTSIVVSFFLIGRWDVAIAIGSVYNVVTMVLYYFHERLWNRIRWGCETS
jgi:uncharacterized membrane protein